MMEFLRQADKQKHVIAGIFIALLFGYINVIWAFAAAVIVGAGKELIYDKLLKKGTPEWDDFWATCIGGAIGCSYIALIWTIVTVVNILIR